MDSNSLFTFCDVAIAKSFPVIECFHVDFSAFVQV